MSTMSKAVARTAFAVVVLASGASLAQEVRPRVAVPEIAVPDRGELFDGCYRVDRPLYGPYRMTFCLDRNDGTYRVRGGGLDCRGDLDASRVGPRRVEIELNRSRCGRGVAWTADSLTCQVTGPVFGPPGPFGGPQPKIAVPDYPGVRQLRCTYDPAVRGYRTIQVVAQKIS